MIRERPCGEWSTRPVGVVRAAYDAWMRIVMIAAECEPWAKTGGLGDVVDALARALCEIGAEGGVDGPIEVFLPRYRTVPVPEDASVGHELSVPDAFAGGADGTSEVTIV